jgi:formylglycine-generating enzyme required for sulfatase activity
MRNAAVLLVLLVVGCSSSPSGHPDSRRDSARLDKPVVDLPQIDQGIPDVRRDKATDRSGDASTCKHPAVTESCSAGWCAIPPGCFIMGSEFTDPCRFIFEAPHEVTLTHGFKIAQTEVTQDQFKAAMGTTPAQFSSCGGDCPVEEVSWHAAVAYCNKLSTDESLTPCYTCTSGVCEEAAAYTGAKIYDCPGYRLPTEAEWEYAYRAGTTTSLYNGNATNCAPGNDDPLANAIGWYEANSNKTTHPVKQKAKNAWGLYDMAGNVREWCHDWYVDSLGFAPVTDPWGDVKASSNGRRLLRGGDWFDGARVMRAGYRYHYSPETMDSSTGFRCVIRQ